MKEFKIYGLRKIGDEDIRYVGLTKRTLKMRLYHHNYDAKRGLKYRKCNWIRKHNYQIEIILIEDGLTYEESLVREVYWIKYYKDNGADLTNMTEGGERNPMQSPEVRAKHLAIMKTIPKEKISHIGKDNWMTSDAGKEWLSQESKKRWARGIYKPQPNKFIEYDVLYKLYITEGKSITECGEILNRTYSAIAKELGRNKIRKNKKNK